jgi:large repetitive protein
MGDLDLGQVGAQSLAIDLVGSLSPLVPGGQRVRDAVAGLGAALSVMALLPHPAQAAAPAQSVTSLSSSAPTADAGQLVTLTAIVAGGRAGVPTGSVSFADYGLSPFGTAVLEHGRASVTTTLPVGLHTIVASYAGDLGFLPSSDSVAQRWGPAIGARVVVTGAPNPAPDGTPVTVSATVDPAGGVALATGHVTFSDGPALLAIVPLVPAPASDGLGAVASFVMSSLNAGVHSITASYAGDGSIGPGTSAAFAELIGQASPTTTTLSSSPGPAAGGQEIGFTVYVSATDASSFPTGTVSLVENGVTLATAPVGSGGTAQLALSGLAPGTHQIVAAYSGDASFAPSTSGVATELVLGGGSVPTSVSLTAGPAQPVFGQPLTVTATVSAQGPGAPTGTVTFTNGGATLGTAGLGADGTASLTFDPPTGSLSLGAAYSGDGAFAASVTAFPLGLLAQRMASTVQFSTSPNPAVAGQQVTIVAHVAGASPASPGPTGRVAFVDGATWLGAADLDASGAATLNVTALPAGSHMIAAQYLGDSAYDSSNTASLVQTVLEGPADDAGSGGPGRGGRIFTIP